MNTSSISMGSLLVTAGPMIVPIIFCSIFASTIIIEKILYLHSISTDIGKLKQGVFELVKDNQLKEAVLLCQQNSSLIAPLLKAGILKYGYPRFEIQEAIAQAGQFEVPKLERRLNALITIAHITPLLGILGTVTGIAQCFFTIQSLENSLMPVMLGDLAGGIGSALLVTIAGLLVSIPTYVAYNFFVSRTHALIGEMEKSGIEFTEFLSHLAETRSSLMTGT